MKKGPFATMCLGTLIYYLCVSSMWGEVDPWTFNLPRFLAWLLYWPSIACAVCGIFLSLIIIIRDKDKNIKLFYAACLIVCIPMLAYFSYRPQYIIMKRYYGDAKLKSEFDNASATLLPEVIRYYSIYPERFHPTGEADVVKIDGFANYLNQNKSYLKWYPNDERATDFIRTKDDEILAPWGDPILFLLNTSGNGYVSALQEKRSVNGYADPSQLTGFTYKIAVGVTVRNVPEFLKYYPVSHVDVKDLKPPLAVLNDADYNNRCKQLTDGMFDYLKSAISQYKRILNSPIGASDNARVLKILKGDNPKHMNFASFTEAQLDSKGQVTDGWGNPLRFSAVDSDNPVIQSAGEDQRWDTSDDLTAK